MELVRLGDYAVVGFFILMGVLFPITMMFVPAWLLRPVKPDPKKLSPYECGIQAKTSARIQFRIIFYIFALLFVIFDVEVLFIFPWAVALTWMKQHGLALFAFVDMLIFIGILLLAWLYAWRKGVLRWN